MFDNPPHHRTKGITVLTDTQIWLYQTLRTTTAVLRRKAIAARRDERGAIPAEVAWIAGIVVIALAVIAILTTVTTGAANNITLK